MVLHYTKVIGTVICDYHIHSLLQPRLETYLLARMLCSDGSQNKEEESHNKRVSTVFTTIH